MIDFLPIFIFVMLSIFLIASAVIISLRSHRSLFGTNEKDIFEELIENKKRKLNAGIGRMSFKTYCALLILLPVCSSAILWVLFENLGLTSIGAIISIAFPDIYLILTENKQKNLFEERYARGLKALAGCLKSNMTIQQSVANVADNVFVHNSIRKGFQQINSDLQVGMSIERAFQRFADDSGSKDAQDVASAISMQVAVGGSEAKVIETIASNIQSRIEMRKEIKSLFAETKIMVTFMDVLPFFILVFLYAFSPELIAPYFESFWMTVILIGLLLITVIGSIFIRKRIKNAQMGGEKK